MKDKILVWCQFYISGTIVSWNNCLVWVLTTRTDKTLTEEGSERSTKGDSETAPLLVMSRIPCPKKNGRKKWETSLGIPEGKVKGEQ